MQPIFCAAELLLPAESISLEQWCALACDQYTSQPAYWKEAEAFVGDAPSTLSLTLPEVYLEAPDVQARVAHIHAEMQRCAADVLTRVVRGFVYVERETQSGVRAGLVGAVDLEAYSYEKGAAPLVRPSENTVVERIPPRLAVRRGALLETPHILMLVDDLANPLLAPFAAKKQSLAPLYDTRLMLGGGRVRGWAVEAADEICAIEQAVCALGSQSAFDTAYPQAKGKPPLALAVGDGNHSLATAKAYWEEVKAALPAQDIRRQTHPARYALVELVSVHSPAICVEPIHRVVFGTDFACLTGAFHAFLRRSGAKLCSACEAGQSFVFTASHSRTELALHLQNAPHPLAVGTLELFLAGFAAQHAGVKVDYIHGAAAVREICAAGAQNAVGVLLPEFDKRDIFRGVVLGGVLPKKTFSMGEATEKRYYLECRRIAPLDV